MSTCLVGVEGGRKGKKMEKKREGGKGQSLEVVKKEMLVVPSGRLCVFSRARMRAEYCEAKRMEQGTGD